MRIAAALTRVHQLPLARPYAIAFRAIDAIETVVVVLRDEAGRAGLGASSPEPYVTGETRERCRQALAPGALDWLVGEEMRRLPALLGRLAVAMPDAPAARAAVDIALHDLCARQMEAPLCDFLGRAAGAGAAPLPALPTSVTIGIRPLAETLAEVDEHVGRGFRILKIKTGRNLDEDIERLGHVRERVGPDVRLRADANQGYTLAETRRFFDRTRDLDLELVEQPVSAAALGELGGPDGLAESDRARVVADESVVSPADALRHAAPPRPAGLYNVKLMKCGGVRPALVIGTIAEAAGIGLMWGCNDESRIAIAAALHAAIACPATRALDLDGSFDLATDVARGGFTVEDGCLRPTGGPGLDLSLADD